MPAKRPPAPAAIQQINLRLRYNTNDKTVARCLFTLPVSRRVQRRGDSAAEQSFDGHQDGPRMGTIGPKMGPINEWSGIRLEIALLP